MPFIVGLPDEFYVRRIAALGCLKEGRKRIFVALRYSVGAPELEPRTGELRVRLNGCFSGLDSRTRSKLVVGDASVTARQLSSAEADYAKVY